jgi:hypothetical protein
MLVLMESVGLEVVMFGLILKIAEEGLREPGIGRKFKRIGVISERQSARAAQNRLLSTAGTAISGNFTCAHSNSGNA